MALFNDTLAYIPQVDAIVTVDMVKEGPLGIEHSDPYFLCTEAGMF